MTDQTTGNRESGLSNQGPVLVLGAGLAGLTAARRLSESGIEVLLVDKGRSVGGRLASRRMDHAVLDHGAQFFTVRSEAFQAEVNRWLSDGIAAEWCRGFGPSPDGYPRYRGASGMNAIARHLADRLLATGDRVQIVTRTEANAIISDGEAWTVTYHGPTREPDVAQAVICTAPIPQSLTLLRSGATPIDNVEELEAITYHKVIAVLAALDRGPDLGASGARQQPDDPVFTFVADNQAKGVSPEPAVTFHLNHERSRQLWDADDAEVLVELHDELRRYLDGASVNQVHVKRWRYAGPVAPHKDAFATVAHGPGPLVLAGDAFAGSKVEGAFLSGLAAADHVLG